MTRAQLETLTVLQQHGIRSGDYFLAEDLFPARTNKDNGHRRTLRSLRQAGLLGPGLEPWANNAYQMLPGTYERASQDASRAPRRDPSPCRTQGEKNMADQPQHDLAGLEAHMALLLPVEEIFVALHEYERAHKARLLDREQHDLRHAVQALALVVESLHNRP